MLDTSSCCWEMECSGPAACYEFGCVLALEMLVRRQKNRAALEVASCDNEESFRDSNHLVEEVDERQNPHCESAGDDAFSTGTCENFSHHRQPPFSCQEADYHLVRGQLAAFFFRLFSVAMRL